MLYPKTDEAKLNRRLFENPSSEYRGAPFWAWNKKIDKNELMEQIGYFKQMGMGGFHIHCRTGLDTEYLGPEFFECVRICVEEAQKRGLKLYLYDEDRWPSGFAGGKVTKDKKYRNRYLVFTTLANKDRKIMKKHYKSTASTEANGQGVLLARYKIELENGFLKSYHLLTEDEIVDDCWYLYLEVAEESPWFNNQTYVDTLNSEATKRFIQTTHEKYYEQFGNDFGRIIPTIFTDEPQFTPKTFLETSYQQKDILLPYTEKFASIYMEKYQSDFLDSFPEIIWEQEDDGMPSTRYKFHDTIAELFATSYADVLGSWCKEHRIKLTGHMMGEQTLLSQTHSTGEAMRSYRSFHLPGIDMLCDKREYSTAKQAQSASHQYGREGVMSELYGVTNWDFDFRDHKLQGDWQAALGISLRVLHLSWMSMAGEAKRDYPASIFYQSPWYKEYKLVEDHFARVNTALTRGKPIVRIGVIHPIESYWFHYGPLDKTSMKREELEQNFKNITEWLLFSQQDFDYISESLLQNLYEKSSDKFFHVGKMKYDMIVLPACETLRFTTYEVLKEFVNDGGKVIFMGEAPKYLDAEFSSKPKELYSACIAIPFSKDSLLNELEEIREVEIRNEDGTYSSNLLYQLRQDGTEKWLFIANGKETKNKDIPQKNKVIIRINGIWMVECYNTLNGEITKLLVKHDGNNTKIFRELYDQDSLLLKFSKQTKVNDITKINHTSKEEKRNNLFQKVPVQLSEPNVLLLDMAEYQIDNQEWKPSEEILRIDNKIRKQFSFPKRMEAFAQPWVDKNVVKAKHIVTLKFKIKSKIKLKECQFAMESTGLERVRLNNEPVKVEFKGYFVDKSIKKFNIGPVKEGINFIEIQLPFTEKTNLECCYLLGDFGVQVAGCATLLEKPVTNLEFGDYTSQGLPFYAGNITYQVEVNTAAGDFELEVTKFRAPLLKVVVDNEKKGQIAYSPYKISLGYLSTGKHTIEITSFGNRVNVFGAVHNCDDKVKAFGPNAWRTTNERYSYEYQLKKMGILKAPILIKK